ncbi:flagellin [Halobacteria archaeon AArc-m2/3/4]|uniref:Flagellin n=1 Tax=Natronoglomus mannanivorans TaxID=2979990 RepID=A0ABT2QH90_9EURY|nr:flagellin [Halobacteria archaeon AArc-m2/3/4]
MFESITDADERGQVGIGTLIVFIAMVLVAAIAAGVLINTAGSLQSQASDTGTETQQAVANQVEVVHAVAERDTSADDFDELRLIVKKSAGSDVIDMTSMTVQYTSDNTAETLVHQNIDAEEVNGAPEFATYDASAYEGYGHSDVADEKDELMETGDRIALIIDLSDGGVEENGVGEALETGNSATVELVDQSGAKFTYGVTMPQTVSDEQTVVTV